MKLRIANSGDQSYVAATWTKGAARALVRRGSSPAVTAATARLVDAFLELDTTRVIVACTDTDEARIMGWLAYRVGKPAVLHYVYVRKEYRGKGLCRRLLAQIGASANAPLVATFSGPDTKFIKRVVPLLTSYDAKEFLANERT